MKHMAAIGVVALLACAPVAGEADPPSAAVEGNGQLIAAALPRHVPRFNRERPVVAVLAYNASTELTDFVVPYGILAEADVAEVVAVATDGGPIQMRPALRFQAEISTTEFDARFPPGADYVIVPNIYAGDRDPKVLDWVRLQASRGAIILGICDGVPVLANAGLLAGRSATAHWRTIGALEGKHSETQWLRNRRYIADGNVITTSGVSASIPVSVALVEAIGGRAAAGRVATLLGISDWSAAHNSEQFKLTAAGFYTALRNKATFWRHETLGLEVSDGIDEISVALVADAYGRTRRSQAFTVAQADKPVRTRRGLLLTPDRVVGAPDRPTRMLPSYEALPPARALDLALEAIADSYGADTATFVALTMEYPRTPYRRAQ